MESEEQLRSYGARSASDEVVKLKSYGERRAVMESEEQLRSYGARSASDEVMKLKSYGERRAVKELWGAERQ